MKRSIMLGALFVNALLSFGCDQCGCGLLQGVQPYDRSNNFGLQWRQRYLQGDLLNTASAGIAKHGGHVSTARSIASYTELYTTLEARGQFWIGPRISVLAAVPFVNNYQAVDDIRHADVYALGDPLMMGRYVLFGSHCGPDSTRTRHRLSVGTGVKIPLGRYDVQQYGETLDHDLQPGTGTWDALASLEYMMRGKRWGTSLGMMGRYNGTREGHRMGHSASITAEAFRSIMIKGLQWLPSAGAYVESALPDRSAGGEDIGTGGSTLFSHISSRMWWRSFGLTLTWQHALLQDQGELMIPNRERFIAGITYNFNDTN